MATTERGILEGKVLPELQAIASSMGVQGIQRLRKADLIGAIIAKAQGVEFVPSSTPARGRRGGTSGEAPTADAQAPEGSGESQGGAPVDRAAPAVPDQPELPGASADEPSSNGPERRTRRRLSASPHTEPATAGEAPAGVDASGNG
ncbi:MAG: Rho termination factor N-terminal domain-containing protein, partial [Actinomycetes bacterium]